MTKLSSTLAAAALALSFVSSPGSTVDGSARATRNAPAPAKPARHARLLHPRQTAAADLLYYGGHVISHAQIVTVEWGTGVVSFSQMTAFYTTLIDSPYIDWLGEYNTAGATVQGGGTGTNQHIHRGTFLKSVTITPKNTSKTIQDADIGVELTAQITAGSLPMPTVDTETGVDTLFMIFFAPGIVINSGGNSCNATTGGQWCGYHGSYAMTIGGKSVQVPYAVLPDLANSSCANGCGTSTSTDGLSAYTVTGSHELIEAITDTENNTLAWYDNTNGEVADICDPAASSYQMFMGYNIEAGWSDRLKKCIISDPTLPACNGMNQPCTPCTKGSCPATMPVCDTMTGVCSACKMDSDCSAPTPHCIQSTGECVACAANTDCSGMTPVCDTTSHTCRACMSNSDCPMDVCATGSDPKKGECVQCSGSMGCTSPMVCDPGSDTCVACVSDSDCMNPALPKCDTSSHTCVAAAAGSDGGPLGDDGGTLVPDDGSTGNGATSSTTTAGCSCDVPGRAASFEPGGIVAFLGFGVAMRRRPKKKPN